jgi:hypothetical protein
MAWASRTHEKYKKFIQNFWPENLKKRDPSENLGVNLKVILEWFLWKCGGNMWKRYNWLRLGNSGRLLQTQ